MKAPTRVPRLAGKQQKESYVYEVLRKDIEQSRTVRNHNYLSFNRFLRLVIVFLSAFAFMKMLPLTLITGLRRLLSSGTWICI